MFIFYFVFIFNVLFVFIVYFYRCKLFIYMYICEVVICLNEYFNLGVVVDMYK